MRPADTIVTGANGFAGSHLLDRLAPSGPIVGWYRPGLPYPDLHANIEWRAVDITSRDDVRRAIHDQAPRRIYHLAGAANVETSWQTVVPYLDINVLGTHHLLESVRTLGQPCRIVVVSSGQIYRPSEVPLDEDTPLAPGSPYGVTKLAQDQLALRAHADDGLDTIVARAFNHIGPRQTAGFAVSSFARQIALIEAGRIAPAIKVGNLDARRDLTDVRDVVAAYESLMERGTAGRAYNVCSGQAWRIRDLLDTLLGLSPVTVAVETDPDRLRPNDVPVFQGDATRLRLETGWKPDIPIDRTLRDTLDWWREEVKRTNDE